MTAKAVKLASGDDSFGYVEGAYIPIIGYDVIAKTAWVIDKDNYPTFLGLVMDSDCKSAWLDLLENANKGRIGNRMLTILLNEDMTHVRQ